MCGIFGVSSNKKTKKSQGLLEYLANRSLSRGLDTSGLVFVQESVQVLKSFDRIDSLLTTKQYRSAVNSLSEDESYLIFGHSRLVTNGAVFREEFNQPIVTDELVGVHNGIVVMGGKENVSKEGKETFEDWDAVSDSYKFYSEFSILLESGDSLADNFYKLTSATSGHLSIAFVSLEKNQLYIYSNTGSVYSCGNSDLFAFASERIFLEGAQSFFGDGKLQIHQMDVGVLYAYDKETNNLLPVRKEMTDIQLSVLDNSSITSRPRSVNKGANIIGLRRDELRRCVLCILPETYPTIKFDERGVCNYCKNYQTPKLMGEDNLSKILDKHRSRNGDQDCIVGLSGGRDSSYGLQLLKNKYDMHPVAYTYDWGLTTDISRLNQSRMCEKLGVEHILRAANVEKKRRNIRLNIEAWLKRPELGMVPLFMAGDKEYIEHGRKLSKEMNIPLVIFATGNHYEHRDFFTGFAGVKTSLYDVARMYDYPMAVKTQLAYYYLRQYLYNPRYLNSSLIDSLRSFIVSFIKAENFLYLFRYLPWNESEINRVLSQEYDWKSYFGYGKNQWRMGDGQTALTNYIFYRVAGFSEYDNFRALQVRDGALDRIAALELAQEDNRPKYKAIEYLCNTVGINMNYLLKRINAIPSRFPA